VKRDQVFKAKQFLRGFLLDFRRKHCLIPRPLATDLIIEKPHDKTSGNALAFAVFCHENNIRTTIFQRQARFNDACYRGQQLVLRCVSGYPCLWNSRRSAGFPMAVQSKGPQVMANVRRPSRKAEDYAGGGSEFSQERKDARSPQRGMIDDDMGKYGGVAAQKVPKTVDKEFKRVSGGGSPGSFHGKKQRGNEKGSTK
jgi:hypothetical protein